MKGQRVHSGVPPVQVVLFDLYETLITEFDPDWKPGNTLGDCFGVDRQDFADAWRATFVR